jgi:hypothetical protein
VAAELKGGQALELGDQDEHALAGKEVRKSGEVGLAAPRA